MDDVARAASRFRDDSDLIRVNAAAGALVPVRCLTLRPGRCGAGSGAAHRRGGRPDGGCASARRGVRRRHRAGAVRGRSARQPRRSRGRLVARSRSTATRTHRRAGRPAHSTSAPPPRPGPPTRRPGAARARLGHAGPGRDRRRPRGARRRPAPWRIDVSRGGGRRRRTGSSCTHGGLATSSILGRTWDHRPRRRAPRHRPAHRRGPLVGPLPHRDGRGRHARVDGQHLVSTAALVWGTRAATRLRERRGRPARRPRRQRDRRRSLAPRREVAGMTLWFLARAAGFVRPARRDGHRSRSARCLSTALATRGASTGGSFASSLTGPPPS